jgi:hypothetical protein
LRKLKFNEQVGLTKTLPEASVFEREKVVFERVGVQNLLHVAIERYSNIVAIEAFGGIL